MRPAKQSKKIYAQPQPQTPSQRRRFLHQKKDGGHRFFAKQDEKAPQAVLPRDAGLLKILEGLFF